MGKDFQYPQRETRRSVVIQRHSERAGTGARGTQQTFYGEAIQNSTNKSLFSITLRVINANIDSTPSTNGAALSDAGYHISQRIRSFIPDDIVFT